MPVIVARGERRKDVDYNARVRLLEGDVDDIESGIDELTKTVDEKMTNLSNTVDARVSKVSDSVDALRKVLVGLLISAVTATTLLALNLLVAFIRGG
jgi:hypothetical protein